MAIRVLVVSLLVLATISLRGNGQDACSNRINCGDCIGTQGCNWCATVNFDGVRCLTNLSMDTCNDIQTPAGMVINRTFSGRDSGNPVNVTDVRLQLSVGVPQSFRVSVTPLRNLPLDLYVLIDLSGSMLEELQSLKLVAGDIANQIRNVTNNVRIGFGSFNDKVTRPYTYFPAPAPGESCTVEACRPNYAFRHQITLTDDITFYSQTVQGIDTTANADRPENGLEGLAQVVACENIIGWRNRSATGMDRGLTRVVLFMTDDAFHYAGEGQLAGILKPYEGECLLDPPPSDAGRAGATEFTRWREVDYPSVGQIVQMLQQREVAVIFAVQQNRLTTYENLARLINLRFRASSALLEADGNNILTLVDQEYRRILQEVSLVPDDSEELDISIRAVCPQGTTQLMEVRGCDDVQLDQPVEFEISVTLNNCDNFQNPDNTRTHRIASPGFGDFTITYTGDCQCDCEKNVDDSEVVAVCSFRGAFVCGVCQCIDGWCGPDCSVQIGNTCDCDRLTDNCPRNATDMMLCYGQGACCEGTCICREDDNGYMFRHSALEMDCACAPEEVVCRDQNDKTKTCVNGTCGCQGCECQNRFFGNLCQSRDVGTCGDAMDKLCIQRCVESGFNVETCRSCEATRPILTINTEPPNDLDIFLEREANNRLPDQNFNYELDCVADNIGGCSYDYFLLRGRDMYTIILQESPMCAQTGGIVLPFPAWVFTFIVIGALLILGVIFFVLIKIILSILDYLEVKRWERETKDADFSKNQNPLYQSPEMKYENVAYGRE